jgi:hypothetical protein
MAEAALRGSVGSVAVLMRVLRGRIPGPEVPDTLLRVTERYKVRGAVLRAMGYDIADHKLQANHWFQRVWDTGAETWFLL